VPREKAIIACSVKPPLVKEGKKFYILRAYFYRHPPNFFVRTDFIWGTFLVQVLKKEVYTE
jgi:hypothetical protein